MRDKNRHLFIKDYSTCSMYQHLFKKDYSMTCPNIGLHNFANLNRTKMDQQLKEKIIAEYLTGEFSFRYLGTKYGINYIKIHRWVEKYKGKSTPSAKTRKATKEKVPDEDKDLPNDVKQLQSELRKSKLYNKLLEAMLDIGKEQYNLDLRKKAGTKRS